MFVATCSGKQPYRIGGEGVKKAGGLLVTPRGGDAASWLALAGPPRPASPPRPGPSLLVLGLTGPLGPSLAAIPATRLCQNYNRSKLEKPGKSESIRQTGGELLKSFRGHLC